MFGLQATRQICAPARGDETGSRGHPIQSAQGPPRSKYHRSVGLRGGHQGSIHCRGWRAQRPSAIEYEKTSWFRICTKGQRAAVKSPAAGLTSAVRFPSKKRLAFHRPQRSEGRLFTTGQISHARAVNRTFPQFNVRRRRRFDTVASFFGSLKRGGSTQTSFLK